MRVVPGLVAFALVSAVAARAHADTTTFVAATPVSATAPAATDTDTTRSPLLATAISIAIPAAGGALLLANHLDRSTPILGIGLGLMIVGPSAGQWYGHETGLAGVTIRTVSTIAMAYGMGMRNATCDAGECTYFKAHHAHEHAVGSGVLYTGAGIFAATAIFDIVMASRAVSTWNHREIVLAPVALATPDPSERGFGAALAGRF